MVSLESKMRYSAEMAMVGIAMVLISLTLPEYVIPACLAVIGSFVIGRFLGLRPWVADILSPCLLVIQTQLGWPQYTFWVCLAIACISFIELFMTRHRRGN